jgi:phosphate transport system protein
MLQEKIQNLRTEIIEFANLVIDMLKDSYVCLKNKDEKIEELIMNNERKTNNLEIEMEENCIYTIAQYEPKASDLRFVITVLKMSNDFERIADHIVNIAQSGKFLISNDKYILEKFWNLLDKLFNKTTYMFETSVKSFIKKDVEKAKYVCKLDQEVDELKKNIYKKLVEEIKTKQENIESLLHIERIINNLERIADLSTNICEDIVFLYEAIIIKHHTEKTL